MRYDHRKVERKWQEFWEKEGLFAAEDFSTKPKYYVLDMFPFPSGSGLHVGHVEGYTATDIVARHKRQLGYNVLHPMGWDSFGLPAEQYALRTGTHPEQTTEKNIATFRRQLKALGFSYDWEREFATSDPSYYRWTQWIFTKLHERGLAYEADVMVNFCPKLGTVLANEEIEEGLSKVGGYPVERRPLRQWVLKITAYADRLLEDLEEIAWPEHLKKLQRNWIGRSEGVNMHFDVEEQKEKIEIFTTRIDTLPEVTFLVLAPEHPLVKTLTTERQKPEVERYVRHAAEKSDLARTDLSKNKTGVFTGSYALHPQTGEKLTIWVADYVLISYGTGAVMGVPGDDERDREFATEYGIKIIEVESVDQHKTAEEITQWLEERGYGERTVQYKMRDWLFSRQRYWGEPFPILHLEDGTIRRLELDELPLELPPMESFQPSEDGKSPLARNREWMEITDPKTGKKALRDSNTMPNWAGSCWYYLRFCDPKNCEEIFRKELANYWLPVDLYVGGVEHAVLHLLYARFWHKVFFDCGLVEAKEPFQKMCNQGLIVARSYKDSTGSYVESTEVREKNGEYFHRETGERLRSQIDKMSKSKLNGVNPDEMIEEFGADALRLYEMFMGPIEKEKPWNTDAVNGCRRFLQRFFDMVQSEKVTDEESPEAMRLAHRLIHGVHRDTEKLFFNTAIAKMMEFVNGMLALPAYPKSALKMACQALSPYAPHLAEECWEHLGQKEVLMYHPWPEVDESLLQEEQVTIAVQVNGKLRGRLEVAKDAPQNEVEELALALESVTKQVEGKEIRKRVFVPNRLLNLVV